MTQDHAAAPLTGGVALLERALTYTLGSLNIVTQEAMNRCTPCRSWDLRDLLEHMNESFATLCEAVDMGHVALDPPAQADDADDAPTTCTTPGPEPVRRLRNRACRLLGAWSNACGDATISVGEASLTSAIVTSTGAVEVAVHGWDVASGCGQHRPIPAGLAEELLQLVPLFVSEADRPVRFAEPIDVPPLATAGERLLASLGRDPC